MKKNWRLLIALGLVGCVTQGGSESDPDTDVDDTHVADDDLDVDLGAEELQTILALEEGTAEAEPDTLPEIAKINFCVPQADGRIWNDAIYKEADGSPCDRGLECVYVEYSCIETSNEPFIYERPDEAEADVDCAGNPLKRVAFEINGTGGEIRFNETTCSEDGAAPVATLLAFSGGGGTVWRDAYYNSFSPPTSRDPDGDNDPNDNDYRALELAGIRVISVRWQTGVQRSIWDLGWITRRGPGEQTVKQALEKPAALIKYVRDHMEPDARFGVAGTSAGSLQSAAALLHDVGQLDYLGLHAGGGLGVALPYSCGHVPTDVRVNHRSGALCFYGDLCGFDGKPEQPASVKEVWDYALAPTSCTDGPGEDLNAPSLMSQTWPGPAPKRVGFIVNNGWLSDTGLGATWSAGLMRVVVYLRTGVVGDWANGSGFHGENMASGHPSFALFKDQVLSALVE
jgi:hypothetical protein